MCSLSQSSFHCAHTFLVFLTLWFDIHAFSSFSYYICVNGFWGVIATPLWSCPLPVVIYESLYLVFCIPFASIFHQPAVHNRLSPPLFCTLSSYIISVVFLMILSRISCSIVISNCFVSEVSCNCHILCAWDAAFHPGSLCFEISHHTQGKC